MAPKSMKTHAHEAPGFLAALDQSGGSTPGALKLYGIPESAYSGEAEMFSLMHQMRARVMTSPAFTGDKVIGAILFERTMDGEVQGKPTATFLWEDRGVVPYLKVDKGLEAEADGVCLMKPNPTLDSLLERAVKKGIFGTKMRSTITLASESGIAAIAKQQFEVGAQISRHGLVPILEPEVSIKSPDKKGAEALLRDAILRHLDHVPADQPVMLKLTIPDVPDLYKDVIAHDRVVRVVALSGGYKRPDACQRLSRNHGMIASFSRALLEELRVDMTDDQFNAALKAAVDEIYDASVHKV
jgi:fructose-bisphosphate aldolase class I